MAAVWQKRRDAPSPACNAEAVSVRTAYLAAEGFADELADELGDIDIRHGRLLLASGPPRPAAWAANGWLDPQEIAIASISDAAAKLRAIQRNWAFYAPRLHRRASLIPARGCGRDRRTDRQACLPCERDHRLSRQWRRARARAANGGARQPAHEEAL
jgi:hypothetical protein